MQIIQGKKILCWGTVGKEPEKKIVKSGEKTYQLITLNVAVDKQDDTTIWQNIECWGKTLPTAKNIKKGDIILCAGEYITSSYTSRDGNEKTINKTKAEYVSVMKSVESQPIQQTRAIPDIDDEDLPF